MNLYNPKPEDEISFKRSTLVIIIILIGILMFAIMFYSDYKNAKRDASTNLKVYCQPEANIVKYNNIQAAHTYLEQVSTKDTQYCIKADDNGELWGSSMQPTFFEGNTVLLKNYTTEMRLKTGDIIRFYRFNEKFLNCSTLSEAIRLGNYSGGGAWINNSMAVIHRINSVYDNNIVAQGDNLNQLEVVQPCQITGIAVGIIFT